MPSTSDEALRTAILELVARRPEGSICPSEVARHVADDQPGWRALMPLVRAAAGALVDEARITATQKRRTVDPRTASGPIRLRVRR